MANIANLKPVPQPKTTAVAQEVTESYAVYQDDCINVLRKLPDDSIGLSVYSPPFGGANGGLYVYSSDDRDLSNSNTYEQFLRHYEFVVDQIARVTKPGRLSIVHCMDTPLPGQLLRDFPGDIIRLHAKYGFGFHARYAIWKEPLKVAIRTRSKGLMHRQIVRDSTLCGNAGADYMLAFRKEGENPEPVEHPNGLPPYYAGARDIPEGYVEKYTGWKEHKTNKLSQWVWQQYASSIWDDIRINRVLQYKAARDKDDTKHIHPLQLDAIERSVVMFSNPGDTVLSPFAGVGSEIYGALRHGRKAIGIELKASYFRQMVKNIQSAAGSLDKPELQVAFNLENDAEEETGDEGE